MNPSIDKALLNCIEDRYLVLNHKKMAIIGEDSPHAVKGSFTRKLMERYDFKRRAFTIFTEKKKFKLTDAERFDVLIGIRPCEAEITILKAAAKYKKKFILLPCNCGRLQIKVLELIRKYPVIKKIEAYAPEYPSGKRDAMAWIILYN